MTGANPQSILDSIKKTLGLEPDYDEFDLDITMHINTAFSILTDLGVGPVEGFVIADNTTLWSSYSTDMIKLAAVKSYLFAKVSLIFDPPTGRFAIEAQKAMVAELEWRLNVVGESINKPLEPSLDTSSPYRTNGG